MIGTADTDMKYLRPAIEFIGLLKSESINIAQSGGDDSRRSGFFKNVWCPISVASCCAGFHRWFTTF